MTTNKGVESNRQELRTDADRYFSDPEIKQRIAYSIEQAERGELTTLPKEDINNFLGV